MKTNNAAKDPVIAQFPEAFEPFTKLQGVPFILVPLRTLPGGQIAVGAQSPLQRAITKQAAPHATVAQDASAPPARAESAPKAPAAPAGAQVVYVARRPLTSKAVEDLPPHDRKVYGLIARHAVNGATRPQLLSALHAEAHTGSVDGAVRRLRVRGVIAVKTIRTPGGPKSSVPLKAGRREAAAGARGGHQRAADRRRR